MAVAAPVAGPIAPRPPVVLEDAAGRARPVALAGEQVLPVVPDLDGLLVGGLRRGTVVSVSGSTSLALHVLAGPSQAGSWCAAVGLPSLGVVAAAELGVTLERLALVPDVDPRQWSTVVAALLDAIDVVLARPPLRVRPADARRLVARARERGSVLVTAGSWEGADVRLAVEAQRWDGVGAGHGHLQAHHLDVVATGRAAAARLRRATLTTSPRCTSCLTFPPKLHNDPILERFSG